MPNVSHDFDQQLLHVHIEGLNLDLYIQVLGRTLRCHAQPPKEPDASLSAPPFTLLKAASGGKASASDGIQISGDTQLIQGLLKVFQTVDIDWEGEIAKYTGDDIAYGVSSGAQSFKQKAQQNQQDLQEDIYEYLVTEKNLLPSAKELADFYQQVDKLRADTDRLEARINLLIKQVGSDKDQPH